MHILDRAEWPPCSQQLPCPIHPFAATLLRGCCKHLISPGNLMGRSTILAVLIALVGSVLATGQDSWIGKNVFWKSGAVAKLGSATVDIETIPFPVKVGDVN